MTNQANQRVFTNPNDKGGDIIIHGETVRSWHKNKLLNTMTFKQMAKCGAVCTLESYIKAINDIGYFEISSNESRRNAVLFFFINNVIPKKAGGFASRFFMSIIEFVSNPRG